MPKAGAGYAYLQETFAHKHRLGNVIPFLSCWISTFVITPGSIAAISLTSSEYLTKAIFGKCSITNAVIVCAAAIIISKLFLFNFVFNDNLAKICFQFHVLS